MSNDSQLAAAIERVARLSALPALDARLMKLVTRPEDEANYDRLLQIMRSDPALAARVLRVANSAFFGQARAVTSVARALNVLGTTAVGAIALAASLDDAVAVWRRTDPVLIDVFHWHSLMTAVAARELAGRRPGIGCSADEAFTIGLLHDIGWLVELQLQRDQIMGAGLVDPQRDHSLLGAALLAHWGMPRLIVDAVRHQHSGAEDPALPAACRLLLLADQCALRADSAAGRDVRLLTEQLPLEEFRLDDGDMNLLAAHCRFHAQALGGELRLRSSLAAM